MILLSLAAIWLAGFGLVRAMFPRPLRWSLHNVFLFSLAVGTGAGLASCLYFLALLIAGPSLTTLASTLAGAVIVALAFGLVARRRATELSWAEGPPVPKYLLLVFAVSVALALAIFLGAVLFNPHGEEGAWSIWNLRARFLVRAGALWRLAFANNLNWTHLDYPLMLPGLVALCWKLSGESTAAPIAIAFLFTLGTVGVLMCTLAALRGKMEAVLAGTLLFGTASFIALGAALYGDVPLSFYILATLALFCLQDRHPADLRFTALAGLMAGFGAWTRNEGIIFVIAALLARAVALFRAGERSAILPQVLTFLAGAIAPLAVVIVFKLRVAPPSGLLAITPAEIFKHLSDIARWILTAEGLVIMLVNFGRFLIPIALVLGIYWYLVRFKVDARDRTGLATAGIALSLTLAAELLIDILYEPNLQVEISTSFERILAQLWPSALLMFFLASAPLQLAPGSAARKAKTASKSAKAAPPASGPASRKPAEHLQRLN